MCRHWFQHHGPVNQQDQACIPPPPALTSLPSDNRAEGVGSHRAAKHLWCLHAFRKYLVPSERKGAHEQKPQTWKSRVWASSLFLALGDRQESQKRACGFPSLSFPWQTRPQLVSPEVTYEVDADNKSAKHKKRSEVGGRLDSLHLLSSHSNWAQLQDWYQLQTKCGLKRSSQVLEWDRQHLPSRDGRD